MNVLTEEYKMPAGPGASEFVEKRSRFIGRIIPAEDEETAKLEIARVKALYHDARHNCWSYIIRGGAERYSDDGEPQGTAGLPMLEVMRRGGIYNVCCIVTRYFGGILLGTGGLSRAYSETARLALAYAGTAMCVYRDCMDIVCPYNFAGRVKTELALYGGLIENIEYGEAVIISALLPGGRADGFNARLTDVSAGQVAGVITGGKFTRERL